MRSNKERPKLSDEFDSDLSDVRVIKIMIVMCSLAITLVVILAYFGVV